MRIGSTAAAGMARVSLAALAICAAPASLLAQSANTATSVTEAYGARLTAPDRAGAVERRVNRRIDTRINSRLALRLERFRVQAADPVAAYRTRPDDASRTGTAASIPPPQPTPDASDQDTAR